MGLLDKLDDALATAKDAVGDMWGSAYGGAKEVAVDGFVGLAHDLFVQPYKEAGTGTHWYDALGHGLQNTLGDVGHIASGGVKLVTSPLNLGPDVDVNEALNKTYTNLVDEPLATVVTAGTLAYQDSRGSTFGRSAGFTPYRNLTEGETWREAHGLVGDQHRTLGGALALMGSNDLRDEQEIAKYQQGRLYKVTSGTLDVVAPFLLDPALIPAKAGALARTKLITKPITDTSKVAQFSATQRVQKFVEDVHGLEPSQMIHKYPKLSGEDALIFSRATNKTELTHMVRANMGDLDMLQRLIDNRSGVAAKIARNLGDMEHLRVAGQVDLPYNFGAPHPYKIVDQAHVDVLQAELDTLHDRAFILSRQVERFGSMSEIPRTSFLNDQRYGITRSDFYRSKKGAPLRVVFQMRPTHFLMLDDPQGHIQIQRQLDHTDLTPEVKDSLVSEYINARDPLMRASVAERVDQAAIDSVLQRHGITEADRKTILENATQGHGAATALLKQRAYDGKGRSKVTLRGDGEPTDLHLPIYVTQNQQISTLTDLARLDKVAQRWSPNSLISKAETKLLGESKVERRQAAADLGEEALNRFQQVWKASVLFRIAYPIRVVGEEQLRNMALFGAMTSFKHARTGIRNRLEDHRIIAEKHDAAFDNFQKVHGREPNTREKRELSERATVEYFAQERVIGERYLNIGGYDITPAFGGPGQKFLGLNDAGYAWDKSFGRDALRGTEALNKELGGKGVKGTGEFKEGIRPDEAEWGPAWVAAVNRQIGSDAAARQVLSGKDHVQMLDWIQTPDGQKYTRLLHPYWRSHPDEWLEAMIGQVDDYLPTQALKQAALEGKATLSLAGKEFQARPKPLVHGEVLEEHLNTGKMGRALDTVIATGYKNLARQPTNILSRNPAFNHAYKNEMTRLIDNHQGALGAAGKDRMSITGDQIGRYETQARQHALTEVRKHLFDLAQESDLSHLLRFVSPFFNAWQEVLTTWGRIAVKNPAFAVRMHDLWEAPDRAGLVTTDTYGNEYLTLPIPDVISKHIPGLQDVDNFSLSKRGLNTILTGLPGIGPIGAIPVAAVLRDRPDLASNTMVKMLFPFGVPSGAGEATFGKTVKNIMTVVKGDENDERYLNMFVSVYNTEWTKRNQGLRTSDPTMKEIEDKAHQMAVMRLLVDFVSPSMTRFDSPYQTQIDAYKRLQAEDPFTADEKFYDQYGPEFFQLTTHVNRLVAGVPPTLEGWKGWKKNKDLIAEHPELGALIIGAPDGGSSPFNEAVWEWQAHQKIGPGSAEHLREKYTLEQILSGPGERAGWLEYHKAMTVIDTELAKRGITSLRDKNAKDLQQLKTRFVNDVLAVKYPDWYEKYNMRDGTKWERKITALTSIANDRSMRDRPDMAGVRDYLDGRTQVTTELRRRKLGGGSGVLTAKSNDDVQDWWDDWWHKVKLNNPAFAPVFDRYLDNDVLEVK